jgi:hypothetical protein
MKNFDRSIARRRAKSLRNGVHHANAIVWGPVCRTRDDARSHLVALALERRELLSEQLRLGGRRHRDFEGDATAIARDGCDASARADAASKEALLNARPAWRWRISRERDERSSKRTPPRLLASARRTRVASSTPASRDRSLLVDDVVARDRGGDARAIAPRGRRPALRRSSRRPGRSA